MQSKRREPGLVCDRRRWLSAVRVGLLCLIVRLEVERSVPIPTNRIGGKSGRKVLIMIKFDRIGSSIGSDRMPRTASA